MGVRHGIAEFVQHNALDLNELYKRIIKDILLAHIPWHGWHAFRRGLATKLHRLGVDDKTIQAILRHSNVAITQNIYIKTPSVDSVAAMQKLEKVVSFSDRSQAQA
jgi:integrase